MIERLNRTYKASYRSTNGFDNIDGVNYDLALWVAYYNFLRPHKHAGYKVLNEAEMLQGADNMPGKWQLLIFLGQQTILSMQKNSTAAPSIEPWNTEADDFAGCEDMPRKSIDIKFTDYPVQQKRGNCTLFLPSGEDGFGQRPEPSESLLE